LPIADIALVDTLIIPGWISAKSPVPAPLIEKLIEAHNAGTRLLSICSGVFVLAATGLLDDKQATTHWKYTEQLATRYPKIDVLNDVLYVDHDTIMTSAGSAAGLDLCLHLVRKDFGSKVVNSVARRLVIPPLREGNQAQFIEQPIPTSSRSALAPVLDKMKENLTNSHSIKSLAQSVNLSERTFLRRFKQSTGTTPGEWLTDARLQYARELLETTDLSIDLLAQQSGFGTATTLRHHFRHRLNISPAAYRKRFHQGY
jgi:AraC family transcriptional activator FtrA